MNYILIGHENVHAVEEILLTLLPALQLTRLNDAPENGEDSVISSLEMQDSTVKVNAFTTFKNNKYKSEMQENIGELSGLEQKRVITRLIKLTIYETLLPVLKTPPAWGAMTGVRPSKFARRMIEDGARPRQCAEIMEKNYHVSKQRADLAVSAAQVAITAKKLLGPYDISLYAGIPFCPSRCSYCSFVSQSIEKAGALIEPYLQTLIKEIEFSASLVKKLGLSVVTLYIGGGTPTTLSSSQLEKLLFTLESCFSLQGLKEFTIEAGRPDTITREKLQIMRKYGVDRLSINPQTMNNDVMKQIGRLHTAQDVINAYHMARAEGFQVINMDVIAGLEGDCASSFAHTIDTLIGLKPENITVHTLAVKRGARLQDKTILDTRHETVEKMLLYANETLSKAGYLPYYLYRQKFMAGGFENVGWCKPGTENLYNIYMMEEMQTILSLGAGGVTKLFSPARTHIDRCTNPKYPYEYIDSLEKINTSKKAAILKWVEDVFGGGKAFS